MKALEEKILREGQILPGAIVKVSSFLNHQLDVDFLMEMGKEIAARFEGCGVTKILTIETSGIAVAMGVAAAMHVPVVFAKKHHTANLSGEMYTAQIHSYTHGNDYTAVVSCDFLHKNDVVLLVDDFLANGKALQGMMQIVGQAGATVAGVSCAIEKGFQGGGDALRRAGVRVESMAIIDSIEGGTVTFRK